MLDDHVYLQAGHRQKIELEIYLGHLYSSF